MSPRNRLPLVFLAATGCGFFGPLDDTGGSDTGAQCDAVCQAELVVTFADGRNEFQVQLTGSGFPTLNLACPDDVAAGGVGAVGCLTDGFFVQEDGYVFPETLDLVVGEGGVPIVLSPEWTETSDCGTACTSADVIVE